MDAISMLPKSVLRSSDFKSEFFGKDLVLLKDAFGEKGYNEFVNKYKKADLSNPDVIDGMIAEMAYKVGDNNKPASFKARGAFVSNLLGGLDLKSKSKSVEGDTGYYSKSPKKYIARQLFERLGINTEKVIREIGEPSLVDLYMNEGVWGIAVSGFETDPNLTIESVQEGGVSHPLFNAKFPGKNPFILDGAYEVNKMFTPIEMTGPKGGAYTKTAAQMLAGSMYVKGQPSQTESSFKYVTTQSSGNRIQASVGNRDFLRTGPQAMANNVKVGGEDMSFVLDYVNTPSVFLSNLQPSNTSNQFFDFNRDVRSKVAKSIQNDLDFWKNELDKASPLNKEGDVSSVKTNLINKYQDRVDALSTALDIWENNAFSLSDISINNKPQASVGNRDIFNKELPDNIINSVRASLRKKAPDSTTLQYLDELQQAKKDDNLLFEGPVNDILENGVTLNDIASMLLDDEVFEDVRQVRNYFNNIGGPDGVGILTKASQASVGNRSEDDLRADGTGKERKRALSSKFGDLDPETQAKIQDDATTYFQRPNKQTATAVNEFLDGLDLIDAADYILGNPDIPEVSKVWMAAEIAKRLSPEIAAATDPATKEALTDKQSSIYNSFAKKATDLGQAVQAFIAFKKDPNAVEFFLPKLLGELKKKGAENITDIQKAEIATLLKEVSNAPEGLPKDKAIIKLSHYLGGIVPMKPMSVLQALWYAKILSGVTTQATNFFANVFNTAFELPAVSLRIALKTGNPMALLAGIKGFGSGVAKGAIAATDIVKSGVRSKEVDKYFAESPLEYFTWSKWLGKTGKVMDNIPPINFGAWKYVGRLLSATDALFATANQEAIANMLAYAEAAGTPAGNNFKKANEILGNTKQNIMDAKAQARAEGFDPNTVQGRRRVIEIVSQKRGEKITEEADAIGKRITMNYDPEGWTKPLFDATVALQQKIPAIKMVVPFARIVANLTENALNYSPFGLAKAATGIKNPFSGLKSDRLTGDERADMFLKFAIGMGTLAFAATKVGDDDDDFFEITASGTPDVQKKYELQKGGWRPYTITFKDGTKISYKDWPIAGMLAGLGHIRDAKKYSYDDTNAMKLAAYGFFLNMYDKSLLSGLQDFFGLFDAKAGRGKYAPDSKGSERMQKYAAQQVKSVAVSNLAQQTGRIYSELITGNPQRDAQTFSEVIYKDLPIVNDGIRPIIDVFGDPVKYNTTERMKPIYTTESEEMIKWLNENKLFVGVPQRKNIYTASGEERPMTDDEYYEYRELAGKGTKDMIKEFMEGIKYPDRQISEKMFDGAKDAARDIAYVTILEKYGFK
jgi:hypothetical protein